MFGDAILLPFSRFGRVFDQSGVKIPYPAAGESKRVSAKKTMEVVIDELAVERNVVRYKNGPPPGVFFQAGPRRIPLLFWGRRNQDAARAKIR